MKYLRFFGVALVFTLVLACNFTEELFLEENGSGKLSIQFDGNELMAMVGAMDSTNQEKAMDSTIVFKELLEEKKDSIARLPLEEQEKLKKLEPFSMHVIMNPEEEVLSFDLFSDFRDVSEINDAFNTFQSATSFGPQPGDGQSPPSTNQAEPTTKVNYNFVKNTFTRTIEILDQELFLKGLDSLKSAEMFLSGSTYTFKYHFPRRVKSTNAEGATFSMDGKTMVYEVNFLDMMKDPESINIEVELEK